MIGWKRVDYEVEGNWTEVVEKDCHIQQLNKDDAMEIVKDHTLTR